MQLPERVRDTVAGLWGKVIDLLPRLRARRRGRAVRVPVVRRSEFDRLLERFLADWSDLWKGFPWPAPPVDVRKDGRELVFRADLPGVRPEDLEIRVTCNHLVICAERREEAEERGREYHWAERRYGVFHRTFPLPPDADAERARADLRNGVLEVRVPFRAAAAAKRIAIAA